MGVQYNHIPILSLQVKHCLYLKFNWGQTVLLMPGCCYTVSSISTKVKEMKQLFNSADEIAGIYYDRCKCFELRAK